LDASNLLAERDSTRDVASANRRAAELLGDSLRLVEKRVVQLDQRRDELDRALGGERRARYALTAVVDSLTRPAVAAAGADTAQRARRASFTVRQRPYTVAAEVEVAQPPDTARMWLSVALDPIPISARVMCSSPDGAGIRSARVVASSPPWVTVRLDRVEQSPELCASPVLARARQAPQRVAYRRIVVGVGLTGRPGGPTGVGWFVGTGLAIGG
ncbi:MAG: hypothetical protein ACYCVE_05555, partial [Gemmatimonadaceae bacterium]